MSVRAPPKVRAFDGRAPVVEAAPIVKRKMSLPVPMHADEEADAAKDALYHLRVQNPNLRPYRMVGGRFTYSTRADLKETEAIQDYSRGRERCFSKAPDDPEGPLPGRTDEAAREQRAKYFYPTESIKIGAMDASDGNAADFARPRGVPQDFTRGFNGFTFEKCLMETSKGHDQKPRCSNGVFY